MEGDVFSDDILNRTQTDKDGYFNLYGQDEEFTIIEPYIKINHFCSIYNKTEEANSTMFLYLPDTVMNSYNHYSNSYLQGVKVEGRILCKKTPVKNLEILLKDEDIFFDDVLAKGATDKNGYFVLFGKTFELSKISPYIQMTWTCPENYIPSHYDDMKFYVSENATIYYYNYYRYYYNFGEIDLYNFINDLYQFPKKYV